MRRANIERSRELTAGNLRMNKDEHTAYLNGEELPLTVREFDLLFKLLSFPKRTFTRAQLMDEFWGLRLLRDLADGRRLYVEAARKDGCLRRVRNPDRTRLGI